MHILVGRDLGSMGGMLITKQRCAYIGIGYVYNGCLYTPGKSIRSRRVYVCGIYNILSGDICRNSRPCGLHSVG